MQSNVHPIQLTPEAHLISSFWKQPGAPVGAQMNTMVLTGREPVIFDTGVSADGSAWLAAVSSVVDPVDVRWIVLSHDDADHVGNLEIALEAFPHALVAANWFITERLAGTLEVDPRRQRWVAHGETLDIGDRVLAFERPPLFDSPTTRAVLDTKTGLYWGGDLGAALSAVPIISAADFPEDDLAEIFVSAHQWNSPWYELVDDRRFQSAVTRLSGLGITTWASTHGPVYRGEWIDSAMDLLREVPTAVPQAQPGQGDLDAIVASIVEAA